MDYFSLFNLKKKFKIDKELLTQNFYKLQLKFHPDLFISKSEHEKKIVLKKSIKINQGYTTLKDSLSRALYLLSLNGLKISQEKISFYNQDFLKKYFSFYEELDFLTKNTVDKEKIKIYLKKIQKKIKSYEDIIEVEFNKKNWDKFIQAVIKLRFFKNMQTRLKTNNIILYR
ncbi:Fe-S protein assembly co-chaperone HscB [Buchnera aphidicola (Melanaphis sacchari)]|uniref:Co-chaperone protein HscB n=1 Tax=Buchnera aphidicola (Melanaphis sacchari) TaxID=2173854 RepID=A0A2U8DED4_9GAMM|nr:Fe-S protein assembly co-chaperone HscB [Buchnera aphidicola]AWH90228.1 Fe-S protein assembly co-chaperone HscB [Buchnera aphidicola (Melanaphis sacchari)]